MATVQTPGERYVEFDEYVEYQLDRARNGIKWTDILTATAGVGSLIVGYLVLFVVADHWLFERGVPQAARLTAFAVISAISLLWLVVKVLRPYLRKVNGLYAARMLEHAEPGLRGSLFGLIDSRRSGKLPVEEVRRALEKRAATTLSTIDVESSLDRKPLMRMSYLLLGLVLVACAYAILSPKRIGPSLLRALAPSSPVGVATRTEILDVRPGDAKLLAGAQLDIEVLIRGESPEKVFLYYSTADRRFVDEPIEMRLSDETTRAYRAALIGDSGKGLTQDLTYWIEANDDVAGPFTVDINQPPAATVTELSLEFPSYTQREPQVQDVPSIEAIEGTKVTLVAEANRPLKSAKLVFADDEQFSIRGEEVPLRIDSNGKSLTASWTLAVRSDGSSPKFYRIDCRDAEGKTNPDPAVYPISIRADQPPEIALLDPKSDIEKPANAVVPLLIDARDPDFKLREVILRLERKGQELPERTVMWEGVKSELAIRYDWDLAPLGLQPGDILTFYAQARDNREPESNRRNTPKLNIVIREPVSEAEVQKQLEEEHQRQENELPEQETKEASTEQSEEHDAFTADEADSADLAQPRDQDANEGDEDNDSPAQVAGTDSADQTGNESREPLKNDGSQDDEVLRRLVERQREKQREAAQKDQPEETQPKSDDEQNRANSDKPQQAENSKGEPGKEERQQQSASKKNREEGKGSNPKETGTEPKDDKQSQNEATEKASAADQQRQKQEEQENSSEASQQASGQTGASGNSKASSQNKGEQTPSGTGSEAEGDGSHQTESGESSNQPSSSGSKPSKSTAESEMNSEGSEASEPNANGSPDAGAESDQSGEKGTATQEEPSEPDEGSQDGESNGESSDGDGRSDTNNDEASRSKATDGKTSDDKAPGSPSSEGEPKLGEDGAGRKAESSNQQDTPETSGSPDSDDDSGSPSGEKPSNPRSDPRQNEATDQSESSSQSGDEKEAKEAGQAPRSPADAKQTPSGEDQGDGGQSSDKGSNGGRSPKASESASGAPKAGSGQSSRGDQNDSMPTDSGSDSEPTGATSDASEGTASTDTEDKESSRSASSEKNGAGSKSNNGDKSTRSPEGTSGDEKSEPGSSKEEGEAETDGNARSAEGAQDKPEGQSGESKGADAKGGQLTSDAPSGSVPSTSKPGDKPGNGVSTPNGNSAEAVGSGESGDTTATPEAANEEFAKQATDLALKDLENDLRRGEVDPKLLEELGWNEQDMEKFAERLRKNLSAPTGDETPQDIAERMEFKHMLENLSFRESSGPREARSDRLKDVGEVGTVNPQIPSEYRDAFEAFTRNVAGQRKSSK